MNRSGYRGVYETSWGGSWFAALKHGGRSRYLGAFPTAEAAARAYDEAAAALRGPEGRVNFPDSVLRPVADEYGSDKGADSDEHADEHEEPGGDPVPPPQPGGG